MKNKNEQRKPSQRLTNEINKWYSADKSRLDAVRTARALESSNLEVTDKILGLIDQGYAPSPGAQYGVLVLEQSGRIPYEALYRHLVGALSARYPQYARVFNDVSTSLERQTINSLELRRTVVCDENKRLESLVNTIAKAQGEERKTVKQVELVLYTNLHIH